MRQITIPVAIFETDVLLRGRNLALFLSIWGLLKMLADLRSLFQRENTRGDL